MNKAQHEMTLREYVNRLTPTHQARREFDELIRENDRLHADVKRLKTKYEPEAMNTNTRLSYEEFRTLLDLWVSNKSDENLIRMLNSEAKAWGYENADQAYHRMWRESG